MKRISTIVALFSIMIAAHDLNAQSIEKGDINIDVGFGFGVYGTSQTYTSAITFDINGVPFSQTTSQDTTDGAVSTMIPITIEYGLSEKMGIGIDITYSNYVVGEEDKDDLDNVRAYDFGPKFYYHPLKSTVYDLAIGAGFGVSSIKWNFFAEIDGTTNTLRPPSSLGGIGMYWTLEIKNRLYFGEHLGMFMNLAYRGMSYPTLSRDNSSTEAQINALPGVTNAKIVDEFNWKLNGVNMELGLALKF